MCIRDSACVTFPMVSRFSLLLWYPVAMLIKPQLHRTVPKRGGGSYEHSSYMTHIALSTRILAPLRGQGCRACLSKRKPHISLYPVAYLAFSLLVSTVNVFIYVSASLRMRPAPRRARPRAGPPLAGAARATRPRQLALPRRTTRASAAASAALPRGWPPGGGQPLAPGPFEQLLLLFRSDAPPHLPRRVLFL